MGRKSKRRKRAAAAPTTPNQNGWGGGSSDGSSAVKSDDDAREVMDRSEYLTLRAGYDQVEANSASQHDKAVLSLSAGALGISLAYLKDIAGPAPVYTPLVKWAWCFFILSLFAIMISFLTSQSACRRQRDLLDARYRGEQPDECNCYATATKWLNLFAFGAFVVGAIFLASFAGYNLPDGIGAPINGKTSSTTPTQANSR